MKTCAQCGKPIEPPRRQFCCTICGGRYHARQMQQRDFDQRLVLARRACDNKIRMCLACNHEFASSGPGNRICPRCTKNENQNPHGAIRRGRLSGMTDRRFADGVSHFVGDY